MKSLSGYEWANRHTWQAWRELYKKNQADLDARIEGKVRLFPPPETHNGIHRFKRMGGLRIRPAEETIDIDSSDNKKHESEVDEVELSDDTVSGRAAEPSRKHIQAAVRKHHFAHRNTGFLRRLRLRKRRKSNVDEARGKVLSKYASDFDDEELLRYEE
jgi:hypothetical protein